VGRVCLFKPSIIVDKNGACNNEKLSKNSTLILNFSKLKPETLHPKCPTLEPQISIP